MPLRKTVKVSRSYVDKGYVLVSSGYKLYIEIIDNRHGKSALKQCRLNGCLFAAMVYFVVYVRLSAFFSECPR